MKLKSFLLLLTAALIVSTGCDGAGIPLTDNYTFSFESGMEGWTADGADLDNPPVEWSIECSTDIASDGDSAIRLYLNNTNDAGKIWIENSFDIEPNHTYQVHVEYDFASADWGDMNLWTIITGAVTESAKTKLVYQENTGNDAEPEEGFVWLRKSYDFTVKTGSEDNLYIIIGVWGTWETARTYYLDNVSVYLTTGY